MPVRRKFIDKKKAITFQLVHRSQHDPLIADDTAGERVLAPLDVSAVDLRTSSFFGSLKVDQRKLEQKKFGIDYDDEYDYLQHLKDPCAPPERYVVGVNPMEADDDEDDDDEEYEDEDEEEGEDDQEEKGKIDKQNEVENSKAKRDAGTRFVFSS
jgi:protein LTV1